jgi:hypothetical protein
MTCFISKLFVCKPWGCCMRISSCKVQLKKVVQRSIWWTSRSRDTTKENKTLREVILTIGSMFFQLFTFGLTLFQVSYGVISFKAKGTFFFEENKL